MGGLVVIPLQGFNDILRVSQSEETTTVEVVTNRIPQRFDRGDFGVSPLLEQVYCCLHALTNLRAGDGGLFRISLDLDDVVGHDAFQLVLGFANGEFEDTGHVCFVSVVNCR